MSLSFVQALGHRNHIKPMLQMIFDNQVLKCFHSFSTMSSNISPNIKNMSFFADNKVFLIIFCHFYDLILHKLLLIVLLLFQLFNLVCSLFSILRYFCSTCFYFIFLNLIIFLFNSCWEFLFTLMHDHHVSSPCLESISASLMIHLFENGTLQLLWCFCLISCSLFPYTKGRV